MGQLRRKEKKLEELRARSATQEEMEAFEKTWLEQHLQARETLKEKREGQRVEKENEEGKWFESLERKNPSKGPKKGDESAKKFGNGEALTYTAKNGEKKRIPFAAVVSSQGKWNGLSLEQKETELESLEELKIGEKVNNTARGDVTTCAEFLVNELTFEAGCLTVEDRHPDGDGKFKKSLDDVYSIGRISIYIDAFMDGVEPSDPLLSRTHLKKADVFAMFGVDEDAARAKWRDQIAKTTKHGKEYRKQEVKCEAVVCEFERGGGTRTGTLSTVDAKTVDGKPAHRQCVPAECKAVVCEFERGGGTRTGTLKTVNAQTVDGKRAHPQCVPAECKAVVCEFERGGGTRTGTLSTVKAKTVDGKPAHPQCVPAECKAVVCEFERGGGTRTGTLSTVKAKTVDGKPAHPQCVPAECKAVVCEFERGGGTRTGTLSTVDAKTVDGKPAHRQCVPAECEAVVCEFERGGGTRTGTLSTVKAKTVDGKRAHPQCVHRTCVICDKLGNYAQVCRVHPDGGGHCHDTLSCYGMHKFADGRGCGLCGALVYETQTTPEEVLENVRRRGTEDGLKRGVENRSIEMPDRPVCDPCMDDVILEKAETLQKEIHVENFLALPTEVQKARVKALVTWLESLNFSSPADLSFESDNDCSESECY